MTPISRVAEPWPWLPPASASAKEAGGHDQSEQDPRTVTSSVAFLVGRLYPCTQTSAYPLGQLVLSDDYPRRGLESQQSTVLDTTEPSLGLPAPGQRKLSLTYFYLSNTIPCKEEPGHMEPVSEDPKTTESSRTIIVRLSVLTHKALRIRTAEEDTSIQKWVESLIERELSKPR